ncbi:hypothetical protein PPUJ20066_11770 [Pseudomonas putida]|nr:hypothetical protein PPUJ20066_11770 [Pseudomonas putida]
MNPFSDDNLSRVFREAMGLGRESNESRPASETALEADKVRAELEALQSNPLGKVGRKLYRLMMKQWPKAEENYDWVYSPGALELIPLEKFEASSVESTERKVKLVQPVASSILPVEVSAGKVNALVSQASNSSLEDELRAQMFDAIQIDYARREDVMRAIAALSLDLQQEPLRIQILSNAPQESEQKVAGSDIVNLVSATRRTSVCTHSELTFEHQLGVEAFSKMLPQLEALALGEPNLPRGVNVCKNDSDDLSNLYSDFMGYRPPAVDQVADEAMLILDEAHRVSAVRLAEMKTILEVLNQAMESYKPTPLSYAASPRNPFKVAYECILGIFSSKKEEVKNTDGKERAVICVKGWDADVVDWKFDVDPSSDIALKGSVGHLQDYWLKLTDHRLSLKWQNKADHGQPETIFNVDNAQPTLAASVMVAAFQNAHMEHEKAKRLIGSVREFVERQQFHVH